MALYLSLGAIGLSMLTYTISRPGEDGEPSTLSNWIDSSRTESLTTWAQRNNLRTDMMEQAAADRHMFATVEKAKGFELRTPEYVNKTESTVSLFTYDIEELLPLWWSPGQREAELQRDGCY